MPRWEPGAKIPAEMSEERPVLRDGVIAGLIGAAAVALWFLVFDIARGRPLLTPALLGGAVFQGITDPGAIEISEIGRASCRERV